MTVELDEDDMPQADAGDLIQIVADPVARVIPVRPLTADDVLDMHWPAGGLPGRRRRAPGAAGLRPAA